MCAALWSVNDDLDKIVRRHQDIEYTMVVRGVPSPRLKRQPTIDFCIA